MMGWSVIARALVRRERWPSGHIATVTPLVYAGQEVAPDQPVLRLERTAAEATPPSSQAIEDTPTRVGQPAVKKAGQSSEVVPAGMRGRVVEITQRGGVVIESRAAIIRGALGVGGQVAGILTLWSVASTSHQSPVIPPGAILVVPGPANLALLRQALVSGVVGVVASSVSLPDLEGFLSADIIQLLNSRDAEAAQAFLPPLTILLTEGPGTFPMPARTIELLKRYEGSIALLSGTTSVREHCTPELLIALPEDEARSDWQPTLPEPAVIPGTQVRVCSGDHEGAIGIIEYLFTHEQEFMSGIRARAARLRLEDGSVLVAPLALIERIG